MKRILFVCMIGASFLANAQLGKMMKKMENKANGVASEELPKGVELYNGTHTDSMNLSGKYYTKFPVTMSVKNAMNMPKYFSVSELTIEYRSSNLNGVFHFINDEPAKQTRTKTTDMTTVFDFATPGAPEVPKRTMKSCNCFQLAIANKFEN